MSRILGYRCGVPLNECGGAVMKTQSKLAGVKLHGTRLQAFQCYTNFLKRRGYVQVDDNVREYRHPEGGEIIMLPKKSKFGGEFRAGKEGRLMAKRGSGTIG